MAKIIKILLTLAAVAGYLPNILSQPLLVRRELTLSRLGTIVKIVCFMPDQQPPDTLWTGLTLELDRLNKILSDYDVHSELNEVNARAYLDTVDLGPELNAALAISARVWSGSGGHFDPALGRLTRLWRQARQTNTWPGGPEIRAARRLSGWGQVFFDSAHARLFMRRAVKLDLGGVGKGYIGDRLSAYLRSSGVMSYFIDLGGDLILGAPPPGQEGWAIGTPLPGAEIMRLHHQAVMGSGSTYQYLQRRQTRHSHLVKPQRGLGITADRTSIVIAPQGGTADAWATAINIMSKKTLKKYKPELLWVVISSKKCIMSKYFYEYLQRHDLPLKLTTKLVII